MGQCSTTHPRSSGEISARKFELIFGVAGDGRTDLACGYAAHVRRPYLYSGFAAAEKWLVAA
jgi:hypothetical protein